MHGYSMVISAYTMVVAEGRKVLVSYYGRVCGVEQDGTMINIEGGRERERVRTVRVTEEMERE